MSYIDRSGPVFLRHTVHGIAITDWDSDGSTQSFSYCYYPPHASTRLRLKGDWLFWAATSGSIFGFCLSVRGFCPSVRLFVRQNDQTYFKCIQVPGAAMIAVQIFLYCMLFMFCSCTCVISTTGGDNDVDDDVDDDRPVTAGLYTNHEVIRQLGLYI